MTGHVKEFDILSCQLSGRTLIEASAGTGKTWNICGLYLRLLLEQNVEVPQILVVTFTTAATAELQDRIRERIAQMLAFVQGGDHVKDDPFLQKLAERMKQIGLDRETMESRLRLALQTFDDASIFTIHSFCQRALAATAFSAGQAFSFHLEPDDHDQVMEVVQDFWRRHIAEDGLTPAMAAFLQNKNLRPDRLYSIFRRTLAKPLAKTIWPEGIEKARDLQFTELLKLHQDASDCWHRERNRIVDLLLNSAGQLNQNSYKASSIEDSAREYDKLFSVEDPLTLSFRDNVLNRFKASTLGKGTNKNRETPSHPFFDLLESLLAKRDEALEKLEIAYRQLLKKLLGEVSVLRQRKQDRRVIAYDDMLYNLYAALQNPDYPWLADSLRKRFPVALIDEFQDTDPLQLAIFDTIYDRTEHPVFLVGDPKQAIYSFRNADLYTYLAVKKQVPAIYTLTQNQRSTPGLIHACNALFSANRQAFMLNGLDYYAVSPNERQRPALLDMTTDGTAPQTSMQIWRLPRDEDGACMERNHAKNAAVEATADEIARLLLAAGNGQVQFDGHPLRARDIAVLVRSHAQASLVKQALMKRNIGSVSLSQENVFHSVDAQELEYILAAILLPARDSLLRTALATEIMGLNAPAIELVSNDKDALMAWMERFVEYHAIWQERGIGFLFRQFLTREGVYARMLCRPDGERRLTNLLHLGELLSQAEQTELSPDALFHWLQDCRADETAREEAQLRLESDEKLVQILTIHKAKGLEYPFVFCPFLWDAYQSASKNNIEGIQYHDEDQTVIDFRLLSEEETDRIKQNIQMEEATESLRLIYVALTRAVYRCYLIAGCYSRYYRTGAAPSTVESTRGLLNWLVAGGEYSNYAWLNPPKKKKEESDDKVDIIDQAWRNLQKAGEGHIHVDDLPVRPIPIVLSDEEEKNGLKAAPAPGYLPVGWKTGSFSGLTRGALHESAPNDHDERIQNVSSFNLTPDFLMEKIAEDDILRFPSGTYAGNCLHAVMEHADFTAPDTWEKAIDQALLAYPQVINSSGNISVEDQNRALKNMVLQMMENLVNTPLADDLALCKIKKSQRVNELEFYIPTQEISPDSWNHSLKSWGYDVPHLTFSRLQGYLHGFIDLVFEYQGRYYLLDWKSNHLGYDSTSYGEAHIEQAMAEHGYHLQYLLYTKALDRFLAGRIPNYEYEAHFGGVLYLFMRGVRPDWKTADKKPCGVYFHRPGKAILENLDRLIGSSSLAEAP